MRMTEKQGRVPVRPLYVVQQIEPGHSSDFLSIDCEQKRNNLHFRWCVQKVPVVWQGKWDSAQRVILNHRSQEVRRWQCQDRSQVPSTMGKLVSGLKRVFRVKILVFLSTETLGSKGRLKSGGKGCMWWCVCSCTVREEDQSSLGWEEACTQRKKVSLVRWIFTGWVQQGTGRLQWGNTLVILSVTLGCVFVREY